MKNKEKEVKKLKRIKYPPPREFERQKGWENCVNVYTCVYQIRKRGGVLFSEYFYLYIFLFINYLVGLYRNNRENKLRIKPE